MNEGIYNIEDIKALLRPTFEKYGLIRVGLIGSYARGEATGVSDVDILFSTGRAMSLAEWAAFEAEVETCLGKDVDLIEFGSFTPRVEEEVRKELVIIYEQT